MNVDAPLAVLVLWWVAVALALLVIVPLVVHLLHGTFRAAADIRRYTAEALEAGLGIASHTALIPELDKVVDVAPVLIDRAGGVRAGLAEVAGILAERRKP